LGFTKINPNIERKREVRMKVCFYIKKKKGKRKEKWEVGYRKESGK